jgi:hypothetical protein
MLGAAEAIELAALPLRRAAATGLSYGDARLTLDHRRGWAVVDQAFRRDRRTDPLLDDGRDLENAGAANKSVDAVADLHQSRRLGRAAVHSHVPAAARGRRLGPRLVYPYGPKPYVYPGLLSDGR